MKTVILLVGPQGSGKTSYTELFGDEAAVISQDRQGPKGHMEEYLKQLKKGTEHIIIDRINHTREQRRRYIALAEEHDYLTEIVVMNMPWGECFKRITARTNHPTIQQGDKATAIAALRTYFSQYERPSRDEADGVVYRFSYDPFLLDLNSIVPGLADKRVIVIGDLHGSYDELMELLEKVQWDRSKDVIVFTGDLIDRGNKIKECLQFAMDPANNAYTIMSNHEWKLARHLANFGAGLASKVRVANMQETLDQCNDMFGDEFLGWLWSLPLMIKFHDNYVIHAGINPNFPMHKQNREFLLYARKFDPATNSFAEDGSPYWYTYPAPKGLNGKIFFGHEVHENITMVSDHAVAVDAGCVFGNALRAVVVKAGDNIKIVEVPSKMPRRDHETLYSSWQEPYEERVKSGHLSKQVNGDLVLYNYTDKCTYEKAWDKYTKECRGLIFNSTNGEIVARPFAKFFNINEMPESQLSNLPNESYECFEKMDGSLGIIYYHDGWKVATRGSFGSDQAKRAMSILDRYNMKAAKKNVTYLVEIIYPENRHNAGARLVIDYGSDDMLVLLGAFEKTSGKEFTRLGLEDAAEKMLMPIAKKYDHTIAEMIKMQETLPADREGFVVRFENGMRVKVKGKEYMRLHRILNSITPLFFWAIMNESPDFIVPSKYLTEIPEEYRDEAMDIIMRLINKRASVLDDIETELASIPVDRNNYPVLKDYKRDLGMWVQKNYSKLKHSSAIFPYVLDNKSALEKYLRKMSRPTGNKLEE